MKFSAVLLAIFELLPPTQRNRVERRTDHWIAGLAAILVPGVALIAATALVLLLLLPAMAVVVFVYYTFYPLYSAHLYAKADMLGCLIPAWIVGTAFGLVALWFLNTIGPYPRPYLEDGGILIDVLRAPLIFCWATGLCVQDMTASAGGTYIWMRDAIVGWISSFGVILRLWIEASMFVADNFAIFIGTVLALATVILFVSIPALVTTVLAMLFFVASDRLRGAIGSDQSRIPVGGTALFALGETILFAIATLKFLRWIT